MKKLSLMLLLIAASLKAQINYSDYITSGELTSYKKVVIRENLAVVNPYCIERDIKYTKRVIRCIDGRQKMNKVIEWPRSALNLIITEGLKNGSITGYKNDSFNNAYSSMQITEKLSYEIVTQFIRGEDPDDVIDTILREEINVSDNIRKFFIMEEWNFDAKHSVFKPKIVAIAPVYKRMTSSGVTFQDEPLCWIRMDDIRNTLNKHELFNRYNDASRLTYDDFFQMRIFDSYIIFENNVYDLYVNQFEEFENDGVAALLKAEEIKNDLFIFEHDLWQY